MMLPPTAAAMNSRIVLDSHHPLFHKKSLPAGTAGGSPLALGSGPIFGIRPLCKKQFQHCICTDNGNVRPKLFMSGIVPRMGVPASMIFISLEFEWLSDRNDSSRILDSSDLPGIVA